MEPKPPEKGIGQGYKYLGAGLRFGGAIVMFLLGGLALDSWLDTKPLFILVGTFVGAGLGFLSIWRELSADPANRATWKGGRLPVEDETDGADETDSEDSEDGLKK
jgi:F0F1-type ATP synthase assembly protein I